MAGLVATLTKPAGVSNSTFGNKKIKFWDLTTDTGDYAAGGFSKTAAQLGLTHVDMCVVGSTATQGTAGASAQAVGVTTNAGGTSVTFWIYESGSTDGPLNQKGAEAMVANFTVRLMVVGY